MASFVTVVDPSARRVKVKTTPGKFLSEVLQEACNEWRYDASRHGLKNNNRTLDLSRNVRLSGLSSGAKLELFKLSKSPSVISVALQLPDSEKEGASNGRMTDKFPSSTSLWQTLRRFESATAGALGAQKNFTGRGVPSLAKGNSGTGRLYYEGPVLQILGREYSSLADLQKTLGQLGFNDGSVLMKLSFRTSEIPLEQAQKDIEDYFKSLEEGSSDAQGAHAGAVGSDALNDTLQPSPGGEGEIGLADSPSEPATPPQKPATAAGNDGVWALSLDSSSAKSYSTLSQSRNADARINHQQNVEVEQNPSSPVPPQPASVEAASGPEVGTSSPLADRLDVVGPDHRPISVFAPPSSTTPQAARQPHNEKDYDLTIAQQQRYQAHLGKLSQLQRLQSDKEIETQQKAQAEKLASVKEVEIKVRFPDQMQVVSKFNNLDTARTLYDYVIGLMELESEPFMLKFSTAQGPKVVPKGSTARLISDLGMVGRVLVTFVWEEEASIDARSGNIVKAEFRAAAQEIEVKEVEGGIVEDKPNLGWGRLGEGKSQGDGKSTGATKLLNKLRKR